jgi:hypothetical protein
MHAHRRPDISIISFDLACLHLFCARRRRAPSPGNSMAVTVVFYVDHERRLGGRRGEIESLPSMQADLLLIFACMQPRQHHAHRPSATCIALGTVGVEGAVRESSFACPARYVGPPRPRNATSSRRVTNISLWTCGVVCRKMFPLSSAPTGRRCVDAHDSSGIGRNGGYDSV